MNRKEIVGNVIYYLFVGVVYFLMTREPSAKVWALYRTHRAAKTVAYRIGRVGITAEAAYNIEREKVIL